MSFEKDTEVGASPDGYPRLARLFGHMSEFAIYRRFGNLSAENLLYLQAEIHELEQQLIEARKADKTSGNEDRRAYEFNWYCLQASNEDDADPGNDGTQWKLILKIRKLMKEYYEALTLHHQVVQMGHPSKTQMSLLNEWMERPTMGNVYLTGEDKNIWDKTPREDLVTVWKPSREFTLTSKLAHNLMQTYHNVIGKRIHREDGRDFLRNTIVYKNNKAFAVLKALATLVASLLPIVGIVILYKVEEMSTRLGIIAAFTAIFSLCLNLISTATVKDIFQATATFAAVLVVFIGTTDNQPSQRG